MFINFYMHFNFEKENEKETINLFINLTDSCQVKQTIMVIYLKNM